MSETLSQDPELNTGYTNLAPNYPPTPATPSSTVQDGPPGAHLPPFSTFSTDMDSAVAFNSASDRLFSDTRLLDISNWDYYTEARLLDRSENGLSIISSQPQYRPWESKSVDSSTGFTVTNPVNTLADAYVHQQNGVSKLPSFQSQFQTFNETVTTTEPTLTTLTNLTPVSPNSSPGSHSLTTLNSNFHTLSAVNPRGYPLVPAPIQAREIPSIQQQFLDERHIQLYTHPNINNTIHSAGIFPTQNGTIIQNTPLISSPTVVTVLKSEPDLKLASIHQDSGLKIQGLHHTQFQNPMLGDGMYNGLDKKNGVMMGSPTRNDFRKKERRKIRASSLESSAESDGASSNMEMGSENSGQVAAVSSTAGFKSHHQMTNANNVDLDEISGGSIDKQVKKKRKRCGECIGCQRKDNCGDCAPCRNDKSHQICKQRRCEKLTEKKNLYGDASFLRGESRRGRGKGRGAGSYRGRKPSSGPMTTVASSSVVSSVEPPPNGNVTIIANQPLTPARPSPQPSSGPGTVTTATTVHMLKPEPQPIVPVQQQSTMTPMPFYADPNRFATPVWQTDPGQVDVLAWTQGQFIQQIPAGTQATIEGYQQYPNGIYQATYQQPAFETNTFYTGAVQVLTRPPSVPNQGQLTPRPNSNYAPSPAPTSGPNRQYQEYQQNNQNFVSPATTPSANQENASRPSSVNSTISNSANQQSFNQSGGGSFTAVSSAGFSPNANNQNYVNSGNAQPGYPQVNSSPQLVSHNSSGYPGNGHYNNSGTTMWQGEHQQQVFQEQSSQYSGDPDSQPNDTGEFSQADRVNLNTRLKTMILNKQENQQQQQEDTKSEQQQTTGHFLSYSHHHCSQRANNGGGTRKTSHKQPNQIHNEPGVYSTHLGVVGNLRTKMKQLAGEGKTAEWMIRSSQPKTSSHIQYDQISSTEHHHIYQHKAHLSLYQTAIPPNNSNGFSIFLLNRLQQKSIDNWAKIPILNNPMRVGSQQNKLRRTSLLPISFQVIIRVKSARITIVWTSVFSVDPCQVTGT